jgi:maleylacetate reductase
LTAPHLTVYEALRGRVVFGAGALESVPEEVDRLAAKKALIVDGLVDPGVAAAARDALGERWAVTVDGQRQHVPADAVVEAREALDRVGADVLIAIGGGSATGLAKALVLETGLPIVAVPTTYAGSEMTPIWGMTRDARKTTGRDAQVLPRTVIYDPQLTVSLPPRATAASGMNAIAHCVEALWTASANPVSDAIATEGIRLLGSGLRRSVREPDDLDARTDALRGAWLGGSALAIAGTALHHKICHVLGGTFDLPHAEVHAVVLPWVVGYFRDGAPAAQERIARALDADDAVAALLDLAADLGLHDGLADLGLDADGADLAAALVEAPEWPAPASTADVRAILERALPAPTRR